MQEKTNPSDNWLLIANGAPLSHPRLQTLAADRQVMVLDGAYTHVKQAGLKIDILLGDFDSIQPEALAEARKTDTLVVDAPDQEKTDFEKGLIYLDQLGAKNIYAGSATGKEIQHTLYNLRMLKKFYNPARPILLFTETEMIRYYEDTDIDINGNVNDGIALLGFPDGQVTTQGLKYDMLDYQLDFEKNSSVSNALAQKTAHVHMTGGVLVIHK